MSVDMRGEAAVEGLDRAADTSVQADASDASGVSGPQAVRAYLLGLQSRIVAAIEAVGGGEFMLDHWTREPGGPLQGEGLSRLMEDGPLLERGGVGFSHVLGKTLPPSATQHRPELAGAPF